MCIPLCQLCEQRPAIQASHIIPAFVFRAIKADSVTGFLRRPSEPNKRMQDGDKHPLLCEECEQRFGAAEKSFNDHVFKAFHESDRDTFDYGDWLHYFLTSIAWRTLIMDLADQSTVSRIPADVMTELETAAATMQRYLLGERSLATSLRNHVILFTGDGVCSPELAAVGPNFLIRRSVGGYTLWTTDGFSVVVHNLAGFCCIAVIRGNPQDTWHNTKISPSGGTLKQPQHVNSWIMHDFFEAIIEFGKSQSKLSNKQQAAVEKASRTNPTAASLRFRDADRRL